MSSSTKTKAKLKTETQCVDKAQLLRQLTRFLGQTGLDLTSSSAHTPAPEPEPLTDRQIDACVKRALDSGVNMSKLISIFGPYVHGVKYRLKLVSTGGSCKWLPFSTEEEANKEKRLLEAAIIREAGIEVKEALDRYFAYLTTQILPSSVTTKTIRLKGFFQPCMQEKISYLNAKRGAELLEAYSRRESRQGTKLDLEEQEVLAKIWQVKLSDVPDRIMSYDTVKGALSAAKDFMVYCAKNDLGVKKNEWQEITVEGKSAPMKSSLRIDEAKRWASNAYALAKKGDQGALASLACLDMGLRSSEITARRVRDLDNGGTMLYVQGAKTVNSDGLVAIGPELQPLLKALAKNRAPEDLLFPELEQILDAKGWLLRACTSLCDISDVPRTTPHGLRRTAAVIIGQKRGMKTVSELLGHGNTGVTQKHYVPAQVGRDEGQVRLREILGSNIEGPGETATATGTGEN